MILSLWYTYMIYNSQIYVPDLRNRCLFGSGRQKSPFWHRLQLSSQGKVHQGDAPLEQRQLGKSHRNRGFTLCKVVPQFGIAKLVQNGELWSNSNFTNWFMVGILTYLPVVGGGSFKNRKPIGEIGCCESGMAERIHWWTERCLISLTLSISFSDYLPTYLSIFYVSIYLSIYLSLSLSFI